MSWQLDDLRWRIVASPPEDPQAREDIQSLLAEVDRLTAVLQRIAYVECWNEYRYGETLE